jgi:hypothetical protein
MIVVGIICYVAGAISGIFCMCLMAVAKGSEDRK